MAAISSQLRLIYGGALYALLFPLVFLATAFETIPAEWRQGFRDGFILSLGAASLMALGLGAVYGIRVMF
jgi:hypothetical protein